MERILERGCKLQLLTGLEGMWARWAWGNQQCMPSPEEVAMQEEGPGVGRSKNHFSKPLLASRQVRSDLDKSPFF